MRSGAPGPARVVLADDHALVRSGFRALLSSIPDVEVVGEAGDGQEALRLVEELRPDLVVLDIGLPGLNGLEVARHLRERQPAIRVLILSMHAGDEYVRAALDARVDGYLLKDADVAQLAPAIGAVLRGRRYLSPAITTRLAEAFEAGLPLAPHLTPRQREVLQLLAEGEGVKEIGYRLGISPKTVEAHRAQIMDRLGIHHLPGLVRYAIQCGLTRAEPRR